MAEEINPQSPDGTEAVAEQTLTPDSTKRKPPIALLIVVAVIVMIVGYYGVGWWRFNSTHASTDDAQVDGDVYPINAKVSGYLLEVPVSSNQFVHKGDLLARIDPREYVASLQQAEASLASSQASSAGSKHQVSVIRQTTGANINGAQANLDAAESNVSVTATRLKSLQSGIQAAESALNAALAGQQAAEHAVITAAAAVDTARSQYGAAKAALAVAQANQHKAASDAHRYAALYQQGAISAQQNEAAQTLFDSTSAQVQQAQQGVDEARSRIVQAQSSADGAQSAALQAAATVESARVNIQQAKDQALSGQASVEQARAQEAQAAAGLQSAQSAPAQVSVTSSNAKSFADKGAQAMAALAGAQLQLSYTEIRAPVDGYVTQKNIEPGQLVQPGQTLMVVVPLTTTYITANFKETQMQGIAVGNSAEITVDAYPGQVFKGTVESIASSSGATFALLPPENATGNFVKVVQRIPVRIAVDHKDDPNRELRLGMSVVATVATKN